MIKTPKLGLMLPETIIQRNRIVADGGTIVDLKWMDRVIRMMKGAGVYGSAKFIGDANMGVKKDGGTGAVSTLYDISGNNNDATQATGTKQPIWTAAQQNGKAAVIFDGSDDFLQITYQWANSAFHVLSAIKQTTAKEYPAIISESSGTDNGYLALGFDAAATHKVAISKTGLATSSSDLTNTINTTSLLEYFSTGIVAGAVTVTSAQNTIVNGSDLSLTGLSTASTTTIAMSKGGSADVMEGLVISLMLFSGITLTANQRTALGLLINNYYAIY